METKNNATETLEKKPRKTNAIPAKQLMILTLAELVAVKWTATPEVKLLWMKENDFKNLVQTFKISLGQRIQVGNSKQSKIQALKNINNRLDEAIEELKIAIMGKFGKKNGKSYYSEFCIVKNNKTFKLPPKREQRQQALHTLIKGLEKYQINVTNYPLQTFKDMQTQYNALMTETQTIDSMVAAEIGNKNELLKQIEKVLNSLIWVIKGHYPDTYKSELRAWGFQKEKY